MPLALQSLSVSSSRLLISFLFMLSANLTNPLKAESVRIPSSEAKGPTSTIKACEKRGRQMNVHSLPPSNAL